jgi:hypothetical protein
MQSARVTLLFLFAGLVGCVTRSADDSPPKVPEQFLGRGMLATAPPYPTR